MNARNNEIIVSISCITYNHAPYIRECLDGFMMQQTNFPFEVLIHDDASTDGTTEIIKEYAAKYPDIIKPLYEEENQWVKGRRGSAVFNFPRAKGKYIALCEGDDYWTDPLKLQKQVDFLESHPDYVMCTHGYSEYWEPQNEINEIPRVSSKEINSETLIHCSWYFFQPLSLVFKNKVFKIDEYCKYVYQRDTVLFYYLLTKGKGYFFQDAMGIYRRHLNGVWTGKDVVQQWMDNYSVRLSIYEKELSDEAGIFLINLFYENISRFWLIKRFRVILTIFRIMKKHFGYGFAIKCTFGRFLGLKNPFYNTIKSIENLHLDKM